MADREFEALIDKVTFISGNSKNSGKTTFLNYLLPRLRLITDFAFLTIGIDGEGKDQIYGTDKPVIETEKGDIFLSSENLLAKSDLSFAVLQVFPWKTVLGKLVLVKAERNGFVEIAGPENNIQLEEIIYFIGKTLKIKTVLIDGAVNRITQISSGSSAGYFYVVRISKENISSAVDKIKVISLLNEIEQFDGKLMENPSLYIHRGAFTRSSISEIPESTENIVINDFTKVFLGFSDLLQLRNEYSVYFMKIFELNSFVVNLYDIKHEFFIEKLSDTAIVDKCIFNPYMR